MPVLLAAVKVGVYVLMGASLVAALGVMLLPNIFHAALALAFVLLSTAALFVALHAEFLAAVQILLYVGAVMTLVIYAIMLTQKITDAAVRAHNRLKITAGATAALFAAFLIRVIRQTPWPARGNPTIDTVELGKALMGTYVFPFEVISVVLIVALIGAIVIARKERA